MMLARSIALLMLLASACAVARPPDRTIATYPFVAAPERATAIQSRYKEIKAGMSQAQVAAVLGEPDEVRALFEPKIKEAKVVGYTQWYVVRRLAENGSEDEKKESLVRVSFGTDDLVTRVDAWGL